MGFNKPAACLDSLPFDKYRKKRPKLHERYDEVLTVSVVVLIVADTAM
jgi:hypothetical protein